MKKISILLAALSVAATANAASLNLTHEAKLNDESIYKGKDKIEYTLAKGDYKLDNGIKFKFDIDRDFIQDAGKGIEDHEGWDTKFGIYAPVGKFDMLGKTWKNEIGAKLIYDQVDAYDTTEEYEETEYGAEFVTSTKLSDKTKLKVAFTGMYADTDDEGDEYDGEYYGIETTVSTKWTKNWSSKTYLNQYWGGYTDGDFIGDNASTADYDSEAYTWELDHETRWTQNIAEFDNAAIYLGASFNAELENQGDEHQDAGKDKSKFWAQPQIGFKYKVNDALSLHGLAGYNVWSLENKGDSVKADPEEFEAKLGFKMSI